MDVCSEFWSGAAINGTMRTDIGMRQPVLVSTLICVTDKC